MRYMLLVYGTESRWTEEERRACMVESLGVCDQLAAQGKYLASSPLRSVTTAVTVRVRDGQTLVTDGPFAETTEQLGGYYVLELAHLDEAIAVASKLPPVTKGTVEIRPLLPLDSLPPARPLPAAEGSSSPFMLLCYDDEAAWRAAGPGGPAGGQGGGRCACPAVERRGPVRERVAAPPGRDGHVRAGAGDG